MLHRVEAHTPAERLAEMRNPPAHKPHSTPSHGINITPDQKEVWVVDGVYGYVYVYDVTRDAAEIRGRRAACEDAGGTAASRMDHVQHRRPLRLSGRRRGDRHEDEEGRRAHSDQREAARSGFPRRQAGAGGTPMRSRREFLRFVAASPLLAAAAEDGGASQDSERRAQRDGFRGSGAQGAASRALRLPGDGRG